MKTCEVQSKVGVMLLWERLENVFLGPLLLAGGV